MVWKEWWFFSICCSILSEFGVKEWNVPILVNIVVLKDWQNVPILFEFAGKKWNVPILVLRCNQPSELRGDKKSLAVDGEAGKGYVNIVLFFFSLFCSLCRLCSTVLVIVILDFDCTWCWFSAWLLLVCDFLDEYELLLRWFWRTHIMEFEDSQYIWGQGNCGWQWN